MKSHLPVALIFFLTGPLFAQENDGQSEKKSALTKPVLKKLSADVFQIGKITFNKTTREITLPAKVNKSDPEYPPEYILVHENGEKAHESVLTTDADPINLNIVFKLLHYKENRKLFEDDPSGGKAPVAGLISRLELLVIYKKENITLSTTLSDWLEHEKTGKAMKASPWIYNGSFFEKGKFKAKLTGTMISLQADEGALANYAGRDRGKGNLWVVSPVVPAVGSPVALIIRPWKH